MNRKLLFLPLLFLCICINLRAQRSDSLRKTSIPSKNWLGLTIEQKNKQDSINKEARIKIRAIAADSSLTREQKKRQIMDINNRQNKAFISILTSLQKAKLDTSLKSDK